MARYRFNHSYRSGGLGGLGPYDKGAEVELEEDVAQYIERDSPGALAALDVPRQAEPEDEEPEDEGTRDVSAPPADRMQRRGRTRGTGARS